MMVGDTFMLYNRSTRTDGRYTHTAGGGDGDDGRRCVEPTRNIARGGDRIELSSLITRACTAMPEEVLSCGVSGEGGRIVHQPQRMMSFTWVYRGN